MVPQQLSSVVHQINAKMMQIVFPMASELSATNDKGRIEKLFVRGMNLSFIIGLNIAMPLFVLAKPFLTYWMTPEIANESTVVLQILTIMYFFMGLSALPSGLLIGMGFPQIPTIGAVIGGTSSLILYLPLIRLWGITGAAVGGLVTIIIGSIYFWIVTKRLTRIPLLPLVSNAVRPSLIALVIGVIIAKFVIFEIGTLLSVIVVFLLVMFIYAVTCWFLGVFNSEEKRSLLGLMGRLLHRMSIPDK